MHEIWKKNIKIQTFTYLAITMTQLRNYHRHGFLNPKAQCCIFHNARFTTARFGTSLENLGFVIYQNRLLHVMIVFKYDVPCIVRSQGLVYSGGLGSTRLVHSWWRHQMETLSALLAICAGNSLVTGEFPAQRPVTWSFEVVFDLRLNKRLRKQSWGWWFETLSRQLWRHCYAGRSHNPFVHSISQCTAHHA